MAVAFNDAGQALVGYDPSATHTVVADGTDCYVLAMGAIGSASDKVTGVTCNGVAMTRIRADGLGLTGLVSYVYGLAVGNKTAETQTIVWTFSSSDVGMRPVGRTFSGVNQSTPISAQNGVANGFAPSPIAFPAVSAPAGSMTVDYMATNEPTIALTPGSGQTESGTQGNEITHRSAASREAGETAMTWSFTGGGTLVAAGSVIVLAGTASAPVITGPSGAAGAATSTANLAELATTGPTFNTSTTLSGGYPTLTGTDAALFTLTALSSTSWRVDPVTPFNFESLPHANPFAVTFNADASVNQACTVTITDVSEPPLAPTIGTATAGNASASVAFTPPTNTGRPAITGYTATSSPGGITGTGASSPVTVSGLTNGTAYTFTVTATNADGTGPASAASNSVTPSSGGGGGDTTPPTLTGSITIGTVTSSSIQFSWPAGSDNTAVTSYEVSSNGGTGYTDVGNVLTHTFSALTASTPYPLRVRAKDAAGNVSTPALAATQSTTAPGSTTYTAQTDIIAVSGIAQAGTTVYWTWFPSGRPGALTGPINSSSTTDSAGRATISHTVAGDGMVLIGTRPGPVVSNDRVFAQFLTLA